MADVTKVSKVGIDGVTANKAVKFDGLVAGEALSCGDACYVKSDGKVYKAVSTVTTITGVADFSGFVARNYPAGSAVTLFALGAILGYGSALTPGAYYWVSSTAGALSDVKVAASDTPIAKAISTSDILVIKA